MIIKTLMTIQIACFGYFSYTQDTEWMIMSAMLIVVGLVQVKGDY